MESASLSESPPQLIKLSFSSLPTVGQLKLALKQPTSHQEQTALDENVDAWVTLEPVNDAVHEHNDEGVAISIVNRESLAYLGFPQLVKRQALDTVLADREDAVLVNPALEILERGGVVRRLP